MIRLWSEQTLRGRLAVALGLYALATVVYFLSAERSTLLAHTPYNHFALLAEAWLNGRLDLPDGPPGYSGLNDFARYEGRWYVVFPPFPAVLLVPIVWLSGSAEAVQDGQFFLWLAGVAPAALFLALERLSRLRESRRNRSENVIVALLFAFGTVYYFSAVQGTVWFAAHVVAAALAALYLLFALGAERPLLAGLLLALAAATRTPLLFAAPLFLFEALRSSRRAGATEQSGYPGLKRELARNLNELDHGEFARKMMLFLAPILAVITLLLVHNQLRFDSPFDFGYKHLTVAWQERILKWGLFHYHYLAKNLGVILTSLPWIRPPGASGPPFTINAHGLALWFTTPLYAWLLWPKRRGVLHWALVATAFCVALPTLFYQNTGWIQFGYRFSNDYAVFLFALFAVGAPRLGRWFALFAVWAVAVNTFGALTFQRIGKYYVVERSQRVFYQPD